MRGHKVTITDTYPVPFGFAWIAPVYRWFSGRPMNGHRYSDATGFRHGTMSTDVSGRVSGYHLLPGYKRFLYFRVPAMSMPVMLVMALVSPGHALLSALAIGTLVAWELDKYRRVRRFRKDVSEPVGAVAARVLDIRSVSGKAHTWVHVPRDFRDNPDAKIRIKLPLAWAADTGSRTRLTEAVRQRLQTEELAASWQIHGAVPHVEFSLPPRPPKIVRFQDVPDMWTAEDTGELYVGAGPRGVPVTFSLLLESPHKLIAGGSGAGKSEYLAGQVGQLMRRGYGVAVLDAKYVSHMWLRRVPGVLYASESEELHEALMWLDQEMLRRARFVAAGGDSDTLVPLVVVMEEMNGASNRLRSYWASIKEAGAPQMSPALTALANLSSMGRELRVHILMAGQSLTAKAVGGPENRENFGGRAFAKATAAQWRMLAPQIKPAPVKRSEPGRWHLVVADTLKEFQAPFMDLKGNLAGIIEWATGGKAVPDVVAMMTAGAATAEMAETRRPEPVTPDGISLRQYADEAGLNLATVRKWADRQDFPVEVGIGANRTRLYDRDHLRDYVRARLREPVTADEA